MIFVNNISKLQQFNLCRFEKQYCETVINPQDVLLQGRLPNQQQNNYTIQVFLMSCDGYTQIADVTQYFKYCFANSIYNFRYFNLQLKNIYDAQFNTVWAAPFQNVDCFTLKVVVKNAGVQVFNKITELYCRKRATVRCFAAFTEADWTLITGYGSIDINGVQYLKAEGLTEAGYDVEYIEGNNQYLIYYDCAAVQSISAWWSGGIGEITEIDFATGNVGVYDETHCSLPLVQLETTFNCLDEVTGLYYGDPQTLLNILQNDNTVVYENRFWFPAELKVQPTDIKKEKTFMGKTQKVDYAPLYSFNGLDIFPEWKMREIETMFTGKRIFVNGVELVWKGGKLFEKDTIRCTCNWIFKTELEAFPITNEYSCLDDCIFLCSYFVIPAGQKDQAYYDENGAILGYFFDDLLNYYRSYPDVISVTDLGINPNWDCEPVAVFKVEAFGNIPNFFYFGASGVQNRIYAKRDSCTEPTKICEGIEGKCPPPNGINSTSTEIFDCEPPATITSDIIDMANWIDCTVEDLGSWQVQAGFIARHNPATNKVQIMFVSRDPNHTDPNDYFIANTPILRLGTGCRPNIMKLLDPTNTVGLPTSMQILVDMNGDVKVTGQLIITATYGELSVPLIEFDKN